MDRRRFMYLGGGFAGIALASSPGEWPLFAATGTPPTEKLLGMYVHEGWPYNHPYAARTWTESDWREYGDGLKRLGFNTIIIWPAIEIMPDPLPESDRAHLEVTAGAVELLREEIGFRIYITLCPNVIPYQPVAEKYSFERRPLFAGTTLLDPADPAAVKALLERLGKLLRPMAKMDGLVLIDSDPSGYPGSNNAQFADLFAGYRKMLDTIRPGIELVYWMHIGWEAYCHYLGTGQFRWGTPAQADDILTRLKRKKLEPWRITIHTYDVPTNGTDLRLAEKMGMASTALTFNYGALEAEPSFPLTNFGGEAAYRAGEIAAPGGVVGNAQTHCMQLPNTFAFSRGGRGLSLPTDLDYVAFADQLIEGQGELLVTSWRALAGENPAAMRQAADKLDLLRGKPLTPGPLKGLLFGDPMRFLVDLIMELRLKADFEDFVAATETGTGVKQSLAAFVVSADAYQKRTGYQCVWGWPKLNKALRTLKYPRIDAILDEEDIMSDKPQEKTGGAYHNRYNDGYHKLEVSTPQLISGMKDALRKL
jgi:hypothetical protein